MKLRRTKKLQFLGHPVDEVLTKLLQK